MALTLSVQAVAQEAGKKFDLICGQQKSKQKKTKPKKQKTKLVINKKIVEK